MRGDAAAYAAAVAPVSLAACVAARAEPMGRASSALSWNEFGYLRTFEGTYPPVRGSEARTRSGAASHGHADRFRIAPSLVRD